MFKTKTLFLHKKLKFSKCEADNLEIGKNTSMLPKIYRKVLKKKNMKTMNLQD